MSAKSGEDQRATPSPHSVLRQGRYKSLIIEDDFGLLKVVDYIHLNPVSAGIVAVSQLKEYSNGSFPPYFTRYRHPNLRCEDFLAEAGGLKPTAGGMRSYYKRLKRIMEERPAEREKRFKGLSRKAGKGSVLVAVEPPVTRRPPHRSLRAGLPHKAPASGRNVQTMFRIGVHDTQFRHPTAGDTVVEPLPIAVTFVTATLQALPPIF